MCAVALYIIYFLSIVLHSYTRDALILVKWQYQKYNKAQNTPFFIILLRFTSLYFFFFFTFYFSIKELHWVSVGSR